MNCIKTVKVLYQLAIFSIIILLSTTCKKDSTPEVSNEVSIININSPKDTLYVGEEVKVTAEVLNQNNAIMDVSVNWSVSEEGNISITFGSSTTISAEKEGILEITAERDGINSIATISIIEEKVSYIQIEAEYDTLYKNDQVKLTAKVLNQFDEKMNLAVNWSVTGEGKISGTNDSSTTLTALNEGTIEIKAELDGIIAAKTFTVLPEPPPEYTYLFPSKLDSAKITFTWLVLIYTKVDIPANDKRGHERLEFEMTQNQVNDLVEMMSGFEEFTSGYTNGEIGFNLAVVTLDDRFPLSDLYWDGSRYQWIESNDITREMDTYIGNRSGWFDNIHIFFTWSGGYGPSAMWGGGKYMRDNITRSQYTLPGISKNDWYVGTWHESIHGLETQYWFDSKRKSSCYRGKAPDSTDIELHGQPSFGYKGNDDNGGPKTQNYFHWLADLTTGNIRDLTQVGWDNYATAPNTNLGFGKNGMYDWGPVRYEYEFKPGGPFPQE